MSLAGRRLIITSRLFPLAHHTNVQIIFIALREQVTITVVQSGYVRVCRKSLSFRRKGHARFEPDCFSNIWTRGAVAYRTRAGYRRSRKHYNIPDTSERSLYSRTEVLHGKRLNSHRIFSLVFQFLWQFHLFHPAYAHVEAQTKFSTV